MRDARASVAFPADVIIVLITQYNVYGKVYSGTTQIWESVKGGIAERLLHKRIQKHVCFLEATKTCMMHGDAVISS